MSFIFQFFFFVLFFLHITTNLYLPQLFRKMLQCCFVLRLQKCFVDDPDFLSAWVLVDDNLISIFERIIL